MSTRVRSRRGKQVFISYAQEDAALARQLAHELKREGFVPWLDVEEIQPGENWPLALGEAIEAADAIVVLISKAFLRSPYRRQEWDFALGSKKHAGRVLPVLTPGTPADAVPWILKHIRHLKSGSNWEKTSQRVAQTLKSAA